MVIAFGLVSCAQQPKTANSGEAVKQARAMESTDEQVKFLVSEANAFVSSDKFDEVIKTAKYILSELDANSTSAQSVIEKAQAELKKLAEAKIAEAKAGANKALDDAKGKIAGFGQ